MTKPLPTLLQEAERAFDEKFVNPHHLAMRAMNLNGEPQVMASAKEANQFIRETILSILSEAERATEVEELPIDDRVEGQMIGGIPQRDFVSRAYNASIHEVKSLWREWRGNLK